MSRTRLRLLALVILLMSVFSWQVVQAEPPVVSYPAHKQVMSALGNLRDSEAEYAMGAYVPGVGVIITIDLLRGPNSVKNKNASVGTRDWAIYLEQYFGAKFTEVPAQETIAFSINYYDYTTVVYHQLVVSSKAADIKSPDKYQLYLDGKPYGGNAAAATSTPAQTAAATKTVGTQTAGTQAATTQAADTTTKAGASTTAPKAVGTPGPMKQTLDFADPQKISENWNSLSGKWAGNNGAYEQSELGKFDLINYYNQPTTGDLTLETSMKYLEGDMGGGLVFNAPSLTSKANAYMTSYTGKGTFVHWGYFNSDNIFQYLGGTAVPSGADGKTHTLSVKISGTTFDVSLDGKALGTKIALSGPAKGFNGLLVSTSRVSFDNFKVEGTHQ